MYRRHHWLEDEADAKVAERRTASLAAIAIVLFLLVGGLFLVQRLHAMAMVEDCLMSGRRNCDALVNDLTLAPPRMYDNRNEAPR